MSLADLCGTRDEWGRERASWKQSSVLFRFHGETAGRAGSSDNLPELHHKWDQREWGEHVSNQEGKNHTETSTRLRVTSESQEEGKDANAGKLS